ncbi:MULTISPECIES: hypothetical protein [unclassified Undibacterium]|uniref:hypothetical protein n=1 Tax=unclassified Undibacterium TaxID=2630295 RepID=UPI003C2D3748
MLLLELELLLELLLLVQMLELLLQLLLELELLLLFCHKQTKRLLTGIRARVIFSCFTFK